MNTLLQSVGLDNLGTSKLQESADDKKTWKQKTDEVLHGRRALDSAFSVFRIFGTIRRTQKQLIFLKTDSAPYSPVRLIYVSNC